MSGAAPSPTGESFLEGRSGIASETKQARRRERHAWAKAFGGPWIASSTARDDAFRKGRAKVGARAAFALEWLAAVASALLAALTVGRPYEEIVAITTLAMAPLVAWIVVQDLASLTIADGAIAALAILAFAARHAGGDPALVLVVDVLLSGGVLLAFREIYYRRRGFDGLGLGDVKLAAAGGLLVGGQTFAWAMLGASLLALIAVAVLHLVRRERGDEDGPQKLAFGAFLAPALLVAWIVQQLPVLWPGGT